MPQPTFHIYSDCANTDFPNAAAKAHSRALAAEDDSATGYYRISDDPWPIERVIDTLVAEIHGAQGAEYRITEIDAVMRALSDVLNGVVAHGVFEADDGSFVFTATDAGATVTLSHAERFRTWAKYVPTANHEAAFEDLLAKPGMGVLPLRTGGATEYVVYARERRLASVTLNEAPAAHGTRAILRRFAMDGILVPEIATVLGPDWTSVAIASAAPSA